MKFTMSWLKKHLETDADVTEIAEKLTAIGLEVEDVTDRRVLLAPFTVASVISAERHPDADKLQVCQVDTGNGTVQVVCGAPNARAGMKGVFAASGLTVPGTGMKLKLASIRGVESNGMLVSERELGLSDEHEGIIELPEDTPVGEPFAAILGLDDPIIEIQITPNRQDCLGVRGIARDLAAAGLGTLKPVEDAAIAGNFSSPTGVSLKLSDDDANACPLFVGRTIRGVKNGPSPQWLQRQLTAIGLRPISALVDITNYLTYDRARPLHVYDAAKLTGDIHVRLSAEGESLKALDDNSYELTDAVCVIADDSGAVALGGVMGGESTGCDEATTDVFVEAALFDTVRTATTGRTLGIESDARYRFERGVDPEYTIQGMEDATRLILELCGGEPSDVVIAGDVPPWQRKISLRAERVHSLCGIDLPISESARILSTLGFDTREKNGVLETSIPPWRSDIGGEADLVEEVVRIHGYDAIPSVPLSRPTIAVERALSRGQRRVRLARRALASRGLDEAVTWAFTSSELAAPFGGVSDDVRLANPISSELDVMRPSLLPNLLAAAKRNQDRGFDDVALFEVGPQYSGDKPEEQQTIACGIRVGLARARHWSGEARDVSTFDAKADVLELLRLLGAPVAGLRLSSEGPGWYHPGRCGTYKLGPKTTIAVFGDVHPRLVRDLDLKGPAIAFEVFLDALPSKKPKTTRPALNASDLPAVERDFAFILDRTVDAQDLLAVAKETDKDLVESASIFDVYEGEAIGEGKISLAVSIRLQPRAKTLTEADIDKVSKKFVAAVESRLAGTLRA